MAPRFLIASLLLLLAFYLVGPHAVSGSEMSSNEGGSVPPFSNSAIDCGAACAVRCSESSRPNLCHRACGTCCMRCNCVPPGTSGNYEACPCYGSQTTHGGQHKCP